MAYMLHFFCLVCLGTGKTGATFWNHQTCYGARSFETVHACHIYIYISMHELNLKLHACVLSRLYDGISKPLATLEKESKSLIEMQSKAVGGTPTR